MDGLTTLSAGAGASGAAMAQGGTMATGTAQGGASQGGASQAGAGQGATGQSSGGGGPVPCPRECDDGNPCNGIEACDTVEGTCVAGTPIECDDGEICNGIETCDESNGECVDPAAPQCPKAPDQCGQSGGTGTPSAGELEAASPEGFRLFDTDEWNEYDGIISQIEAHASTTPTALTTIMSSGLNRFGNAITVNGLDCFHDGFEWNSGDGDVDYWWPQGVTGSTGAFDNATDQGKLDGRRVMAVSWYHKAEEDPNTSSYKGVRVTLVDHSSTQAIAYRHVLLVKPVLEGAVATYEPLAGASSSLHAGGIAWVGNYLYVASTSTGFKVFDLNRVMEVTTGDKALIGYQQGSDEYHAYNYRYILPQIGEYRICDSTCCARFSFVSLDTSTTPKSLLAGEYFNDGYTGRLHRWPLDEQTDKLLIEGGGVQSNEALFPGVEYMQGGMSYGGTYFISSSYPKVGFHPSPGTFHHGNLGGSTTEHQYPYLPEDLYFAKYTDEIWTCTESPNSVLGNTRYCFSFLRSDVLNNCN